MQGFARFAAFQCAQRVPPQPAKKFTVGGGGVLWRWRSSSSSIRRAPNGSFKSPCHRQCGCNSRTDFHYVFIKIEQKESGEIACFQGAQKQPCGRCCATAVRAILCFNPYKHVTNVIPSHKPHVECVREERTAFHLVFLENEQKKSSETACFSGAQKV